MSAPMIAVQDLHKTYHRGGGDVHALRGVDLAVEPGHLVVLTGRSGSGKTTLLHLVAGLRRADRGTITVDGLDVTGATEPQLVSLRRRTVGVIHQDLALLPLLTAEENVGLPLRLARTSPAERDDVVAGLLADVGLASHARQRPDEMSGGQQQRVAIARAIVGERRLIRADEPTGALDTDTGEEILRLLRNRCDAGAAGVLVTHEARHAAWADRVVFIRDGVIVDESGSDSADVLLEARQ